MNLPTQPSGAALRGSSFLPQALHVSLRRILTVAPLLAFCAAVPAAFAGASANPTYQIGFTVTDENGQTIGTTSLSGAMNYDPATGSLNTPAPGDALPANWSWTKMDLTDPTASLPSKVLTWQSATANADGPDSFVQLKTSGNVDPFMSYSFAAKNNTSTVQTYTFSYGESIVPPVSGNYSIYSDIAGSLTHGTISSFAQISPVLGDFDGDGISEIQTLKLSTDGGATFFNAGVDVGLALSRTPSGTTIFGPTSDTVAANLAQVNYWQFDVSFSLTPGKDAAALSGFAEISAIPEPSTYAGIMGVFVLAGATLRRRLRFAA